MEERDLPVGWAMATVGELTNVGPKNETADETEVGFVPLQRLGVTYLSRHTHEPRVWKEVKKGYTQFQNGDVLLARITPSFENGKAGIARDLPNGLGAGSTEYIVFRPFADALDPRYLLAHFKTRSFLTSGEMVMTGAVGQQRVPKAFVLESQLPLAPLNEQRRIAAKLDTTLAAVDACRQRLDGVAAILKRFRQAVLAAATSGELTREWREETGARAWTVEKATDACAKVQSGGTPKEGFIDEPGVPFLKVYNLVNQEVDFRYKPQFVRPEVHLGPLAKSRVMPGDVLMNIVGPPLGKVAIAPDDYDEWNINQAITLFRPSEKIRSRWIYCLLCEGSAIREIEFRTKGSAGQVNISLTQCRDFDFPVPSIKEQDEIIERVEFFFSLAHELEAKLTAARRIVDRLTPALLAKGFRGELVPQDPSDEPASELLEKIRAASNARSAGSAASQRGRRKATDHSELSSLATNPVPTNDHSRVVLVRTGDETTQGGRGPNRVSKSKSPDNLKGWSPMQNDLIQILEQHQGWISASTACEEMGISDGSSSDDLELFFRQLKEQVEGGAVDVQRRGDEDWLKLTSRKVA